MVIIGRWNMNTVLHELGHTVGLIDEHMRPDRDLYMEVLQDNIFPVRPYHWSPTDLRWFDGGILEW